MLTFMGEEWSETVIHIHVAIRKAELWKDPGTGTGWGAASGRAVRWLGGWGGIFVPSFLNCVNI